MVDPGVIFRHAVGLTGRSYIKESDITIYDKKKYILEISLPNGNISNYEDIYNEAVNIIAKIWLQLIASIHDGSSDDVVKFIADWNLDTGVDESNIVLWPKREA